MRFCSDDLLDRLDAIKRPFAQALVMNGAATTLIEGLRARCITVDIADPGQAYARGGCQFDEDSPALPAGHYDLILSLGLLDTVNDLPGALALFRRGLKPGGLFLAQCAGAGSLNSLRVALRALDPAVQRCHPMFDVRAVGDLLARAGFVRSVADVDAHQLSYARLTDLLADLRAHAATNILRDRHMFARSAYRELCLALADAEPFAETLSIITFTGWASES